MGRVTCGHAKPICYELGLCIGCLRKALAKEGLYVPGSSRTVYEWQICDACRSRVVYYNIFGLCLHCAVKTFAPDFEQLASQPDESGPEPDFPEHNEFQEPAPCLTDIEQIIVTLHERESYSMGQIGELLQLSEKMVGKIYFEALEKNQQPSNQERTSL